MRLHGLLLTRDDGDIIDECIAHSLSWCDALYVFDTGSSDDTWERANEWALRDSRVVLIRKCKPAVMMSSPLRGYVFNLVRDKLEPDDWLVQQDADEIYHVSPRQFISTQLKPGETAVYNQHFEFRIAGKEVSQWQGGDKSIFDRKKPIAELRRYYNILTHSEPRMFQYRLSMQWGSASAYPWNMGFIARKRIPIRHYPHRDPLSLQVRLTLRNHLLPLSVENWSHWAVKNWKHYIADDQSPSLLYWPHGSNLPEVQHKNHLRVPIMRVVQRFLHQFCLPILDRTRPKFPATFTPTVIPSELNSAAITELSTLRRAGLDALRG